MKRIAAAGRWALLALVIAAPGLGCHPGASAIARQPAGPGLHAGAIEVDGRERTFAAYVPRVVAAPPAIVLVLHGGSGGSGARIRSFIGAELEAAAEAGGFLVVYPDGLGGNWNDCRADASYSSKLLGIDDVSFLRALARHLAQAYGADPGRVFAIGYSNGGHLAYRMALEAPGALRGIAVFGANLPAADALDCREAGSFVPVMIVNGTADVINPFEGGEVVAPDGTRLGNVRSAEESLAYFGALAGQRGEPAREVVIAAAANGNGAGTWVERSGWRVPGRAAVVLYTVHGGGHTIPSAAAAFPPFLGPVERRFAAVAEALRFFGLR